MLSHLKIPQNEITVLRPQTDRDGDALSSIEVGIGYGIFRTRTHEELDRTHNVDFMWVGILNEFTPHADVANPAEPILSILQGDICRWRGREYYVGNVMERFDVNGDFVGYWLECTNRSSRAR